MKTRIFGYKRSTKTGQTIGRKRVGKKGERRGTALSWKQRLFRYFFLLEKERLVLVGNEKGEWPFGKVGKGEELIIFLRSKELLRE